TTLFRAEVVGSCQTPDGVVVERITGVLVVVVSLVDVEVEVQRLLFGQRQGVVQVAVVLLPVVFDVGSVEGTAEVVGEGVADADDVSGFDAEGVAVGGALAAHCGETTGAQLQAFDLVAHQVGTGGGFRQDAAVVGGEDRAGNELVTILQHGVGDAELDGAADFGLGVVATAVVGLVEQTVA